MNISIIGSGYVGLTSAIGLAGNGHKVICIDTDEDKVKQINQGNLPFCEAGLESRLAYCVNEGKTLKSSSDYHKILNSDITFICVGTPCNSDGSVDLSFIKRSATEMGLVLARANNYHIVVVRSTLIPGTTEEVIIPILEECSGKKAGKDFGVAFNPEFLQEGKALQGFINPDKIIIGEYDLRAGDVLQEFFGNFPPPIIRTDVKTAEMIKYASNAFLATKISFINEIGNICKKLGIDVYEVAKAIGYDPRIGSRFLNAGIGFGGSCLPKDVSALVHMAEKLGYKTELLQSVLNINTGQLERLLEITRKRLGNFESKIIAVLGLAFKPNTDDIRQAPAFKIIGQLLAEGAVIKAYDPMAMPNAQQVLPSEVEFCESIMEAIAGSNCVLITTEWDEFKDERLYAGKLVIDGRRALNPEKARKVCQYYEGVCW
jgi:UDPglucose 6-dehydrogenase